MVTVNFNCDDCGLDTSKAPHDYYMIHDYLWAAHGSNWMLCLSCITRRVGRPLDDNDFTYRQ